MAGRVHPEPATTPTAPCQLLVLGVARGCLPPPQRPGMAKCPVPLPALPPHPSWGPDAAASLLPVVDRSRAAGTVTCVHSAASVSCGPPANAARFPGDAFLCVPPHCLSSSLLRFCCCRDGEVERRGQDGRLPSPSPAGSQHAAKVTSNKDRKFWSSQVPLPWPLGLLPAPSPCPSPFMSSPFSLFPTPHTTLLNCKNERIIRSNNNE